MCYYYKIGNRLNNKGIGLWWKWYDKLFGVSSSNNLSEANIDSREVGSIVFLIWLGLEESDHSKEHNLDFEEDGLRHYSGRDSWDNDETWQIKWWNYSVWWIQVNVVGRRIFKSKGHLWSVNAAWEKPRHICCLKSKNIKKNCITCLKYYSIYIYILSTQSNYSLVLLKYLQY
jgi:hypothetical protein